MRRRWSGSVRYDRLLTGKSGGTVLSVVEMLTSFMSCLPRTGSCGRQSGKRSQIVLVENIVDVSVMITLACRGVVSGPVTVNDELFLQSAIVLD